MSHLPQSKKLAGLSTPGNIRPTPASYYLDPALYRAFPARHRAQLAALFNLLVAFGRGPDRTVLATQAELAEFLGLSIRQVRRLEVELEELGAVRARHDIPGLRGGRALELVELIDWLPEEAWHGPRRTSSKRAEPSPESFPRALPEVVDNSATADQSSAHGGLEDRPRPESLSTPARARQSLREERVTRGPSAQRAPSPANLARRMFAFLARSARISGRRWEVAVVALEALVAERGEAGAWDEVERIEKASRAAVNPGGYAFACLFPDGPPETRGSGLRALERSAQAGPLFQSLDEDRPTNPSRRARPARSPSNATPRASERPSAP